ncbi:MAG: FHA domain-containing protein [Polyangiales bacterium]
MTLRESGRMGVRLQIESGWIADGRVSLSFDQDRIVIGRRGGCDVQLPHTAVSGHHATIRASGPNYSVIDEGSTNGVRVNGERVVPGRAKPIADGDVLDIGGFSLVVSMEAVAISTSADGTAAAALRLFRIDPNENFKPPSLFFVNGSRAGEWVELPAPPSNWTAGRGDEADLHIDDADVSREHAEIVHDLEGVVIRDLGSKNGVLVGERSIRTKRLAHGDELTLGATILRFEDPASASLATMLGEDDAAMSELPVGPSSPSAKPAQEVFDESEDSEDSDEERAGEAPDEAGDSMESLASPEARKESPSELPAAPSGGGADVAIYALAGTVLALSLAGLYWLFTSH